jgi:hypothetical protein
MSERKLIQACKRSDVKAVQVYYHFTSFFSSKFCFFNVLKGNSFQSST